MAKVILICGKICSGKSYYALKLKKSNNAVILSCDELVQNVFPYDLGDQHDEIVKRIKRYLYKKSSEIVATGADVILEFGFWSRKERKCVSDYYSSLNILFEWHYIDISDDDWMENIKARNQLVSDGLSQDYYLDDGLMNKLSFLFEKPCKQEMAVWYTNHRIEE